MSDQCGKRQPTGLDICTRPPHSNKTPHHDNDTGRTWGGKRKPNPLIARTGIKQKSPKQVVRTDFLMGIKAERLRAQIEQRGEPFCEECNRLLSPDLYGSPEYGGDDEYVEACMSMLDLDHIKNRSQGRPYKGPSDHGIDSPLNLRLLCRPCHALKHEGTAS